MKNKKVIKGSATEGVHECLLRHEAYAKWIFPLQDANALAARCDNAEVLLDYTYSQIMKHVSDAETLIKKLQHFVSIMKHSHEDYIEHRTFEMRVNQEEDDS